MNTLNAAWVPEGRIRLELGEGEAQERSLRPVLACFGGGGGGQSVSSTTTSNVDKSLTANADLFALQDTTVSVADGGSVSIITKDPGAALAAIDAIQKQTGEVGDLVREVSKGSNAIAAQVAASQEQFVATASGQKYVLWGLLVVAVIGLVVMFKKLFN